MSDIFNLSKPNNSDPYSLGKTGRIRTGFNQFIDKHPNWMLYVRRDIKYPCDYCWDPYSKSPDPTCQRCFGTGYKVQYEKHKVRRVIAAKDAQSPLEGFGYLSKFKTVIYGPRYYYPKSKDLYLEVEWDVEWQNIENFGKPLFVVNAFQVDESISFREDEVSYIASGCDTYNFSIDEIDAWVKQLGQVYVRKQEI